MIYTNQGTSLARRDIAVNSVIGLHKSDQVSDVICAWENVIYSLNVGDGRCCSYYFIKLFFVLQGRIFDSLHNLLMFFLLSQQKKITLVPFNPNKQSKFLCKFYAK